MSHLKERKEKICLNCQAALYGRYCHQCGQENLEPKETVGHLVLHFFNDVTHFDGKFFSTVKYLLKRPGFLSAEYVAGRRASYLNPIRMYVFSSAIFFLLFFSIRMGGKSLVHFEATPDKQQYMGLSDLAKQRGLMEGQLRGETDEDDRRETRNQINRLNTEIAVIRLQYGDTSTRTFAQGQRSRMWTQALEDSMRAAVLPAEKDRFSRLIRDESDSVEPSNFWGLREGRYKRVSFYDSVQRGLPETRRDGWFKKVFMRELIATEEKFGRDKAGYLEHLEEGFLHFFPKIFFFSLPFFALILKWVYSRHKQYYYVDHGIFAVHVYCAVFVLESALLLLNGLYYWLSLKFMAVVFQVADFVLILYMLSYLYLAMRSFYKQEKGKTFVKYLLVGLMALVLNGFLALLFLVISALLI